VGSTLILLHTPGTASDWKQILSGAQPFEISFHCLFGCQKFMIKETLHRLRGVFETRFGKSRPRRVQSVMPPEVLETRQLLAATGIQAFHRSGQTFLTWTEDGAVTGEKYHVYRSTSAITTANLAQARKLTSKWGPLDDKTSVHQKAAPGTGVPSHFVIQDLGTPLPDHKGLFVYTTPNSESGTYYYAVTQVTNGVESLVITAGANSLTTGVSESVAVPTPVLTVSNASGKGRIYTQFMDYAKWNPTFQGYAYNYSVALPDNYDPSVAWPVKLMPHAYGERFRMEPSAEYGWPLIEVFVDDSGGGAPGDRFQTWWYGFAADHNYLTSGSIPTSGRVENFTEQRVLKTIDEVSSMFSVDSLRIHSQGHSMGASGSLSLGMRYANVFGEIFASEPMTNYGTSPGFQTDFSVLWGTQASNLPIVNNGVRATHLKKHDGMGVYNWMNHHEQLTNRRGEPMAFLMVGHGKADDVIDWATQGRPFIAALNAANVGFTAEQRFGWDHNWMSFDFLLDSMFNPGDSSLSNWAYLRTVSFPGITNATESGPNVPGTSGTNFYNMNIEWSVPWNPFGEDIVDTALRYEITLRSTTIPQAAEITPQRLQAFDAPQGTTVTWKNINNATGQTVQSGTVVSDVDGLVTLPRVQIGTGSGNRLILTIQVLPAVLTGPAATTTSLTPQITWSATRSTISYDVWITNLSTGQNPVLQVNVPTNAFTPATEPGIGRYRVWVRSRLEGGQLSAWSAPRDFQINTAPTIADLPSPVYSGLPRITWSSLPGAVKYDLWVNNNTTGQNQVVRMTSLTSNSYQVTGNLGLGVYVAWVRGIDVSNTVGQWSSPSRFTSASLVTLTSPNLPTFSNTPGFQWLSVGGASSYQVFVQNRKTGLTVINQVGIADTSWTPGTSLPDGDYRWWGRASSASGIVGGWSAPMDFSVGGRPIVLSPTGTTGNRTPTFSWTTVQGAARYELWVAGLDGSGVVINLTSLTTNSHTPVSSLAPRTYRVWVRAFSTTNVVSEWSAPVDVTITKLDSLRPDLEVLARVIPTGRDVCSVACKPAASFQADPIIHDRLVLEPASADLMAEEAADIDQIMSEWPT